MTQLVVGPGGTQVSPEVGNSPNSSTIAQKNPLQKIGEALKAVAKPFRHEKRASKEEGFDFPNPNETNSNQGASSRPEHWKFPTEEESRRIKQARTQSGDSTLQRHLEGEAARSTTGLATFSDAPVEHSAALAAFAQRKVEAAGATVGFPPAKVEHSAALAEFAERNRKYPVDQVIGKPPTAGSNTIDGKTAAEMYNRAIDNARRDLENMEKAVEKKEKKQ